MDYLPPWWLRNGHFQSIYPSVFRHAGTDFFEEEVIDTPDGDFLELDWVKKGNRRVVLLTHGLEGNSRRPYMAGMAKAMSESGWDVLAWNFRSCGKEMNRHLRSYHSGFTDDMHDLLHLLADRGYEQIGMVGFSIGGNKTLKYLGMCADEVPKEVVGAVAFSVPCHLSSSSVVLAKPTNRIYMLNFLKTLEAKLIEKDKRFPGEIDLSNFRKIKTFAEYDSRYTAPLNGFASAEEYWEQSSSRQFLEDICVPALLVNALDDPFLSEQCFPYDAAHSNPHFTFEATKFGGHVGFMPEKKGLSYWSERRAQLFFSQFD